MRAYLLGELDDHQSDLLEARYFTDPEVFRAVRDAETDLIRDYLRHRLTAAEIARFEARYLSVPELKKRLEEVRRSSGPAPMIARYRWQVAVASVLVVFGGAVALFLPEMTHRNTERIARLEPGSASTQTIRLVPGLAKDAAPGKKEFRLRPGRVQVTFELPGRSATIECEMRLLRVVDAGGFGPVLNRRSLRSRPVTGGQQVEVDLDASSVEPGDYVAEVLASGGVLETYPFRILGK